MSQKHFIAGFASGLQKEAGFNPLIIAKELGLGAAFPWAHLPLAIGRAGGARMKGYEKVMKKVFKMPRLPHDESLGRGIVRGLGGTASVVVPSAYGIRALMGRKKEK
jgi:hypothetical protein